MKFSQHRFEETILAILSATLGRHLKGHLVDYDHVHVWDYCSTPVLHSLVLCPLLPTVPTEWPHTFAHLFLLKSSLEDSRQSGYKSC